MAYERIVAAAMKGESALWEIADELVKETGSACAGERKAQHDGSRHKIKEIADTLAAKGLDKYNESTLAVMRITASYFTANDRVPSLSFTVHSEAGNPDILEAAIKAAETEGCDVSKRFVRTLKSRLDAEERGARREAHKEAVAAQREAKAEEIRAREERRKANSKEAKEAAAKREQKAKEEAKEAGILAKQLKGPPPINHSAKRKSPADTPSLVVRTSFMSDVSKAKSLVGKMNKDIEPHLGMLTDAFVGAAVEELLEIAEAFRQLSHKVRSAKTNKRSHLYAVGE